MLLNRRRNDPQANTEELSSNLLDIVTYHGRDFQQYALDNEISFAPIDEVGILFLMQLIVEKTH